ncbi:hypothetical protein L7F22_034080 [Adiantum nelumboides]|nr:hypothetical protein [Adiantum nelumboides]
MMCRSIFLLQLSDIVSTDAILARSQISSGSRLLVFQRRTPQSDRDEFDRQQQQIPRFPGDFILSGPSYIYATFHPLYGDQVGYCDPRAALIRAQRMDVTGRPNKCLHCHAFRHHACVCPRQPQIRQQAQKDPKDWQTDLANNAETFWSTTVDVVSQFNPIQLAEATGNGIQSLVEASAERFAAFELSTLVALGERWILWTPFVIIPMYWQMTRTKKNVANSDASREISQAVTVELSEAAVAKAARVRNELERIELKASLLDLVYSLGKLAWQSNGSNQDVKRRQIDEILTKLQDLSPTSSSDLGSVLVTDPPPELPYTQPSMDVDGDWNLIYVSQDSSQGEPTQFSQLLGLNIPGFELSNMRQKLWREGLKTALVTSEIGAEPLVAKNTAEVRLGPFGVVEVSVQGSWENQLDGKSALVSFQTFSAKPVELLGSRVREDLPPLDLAIPSTLQTSGEWKTVYLDNSLRINRGKTGQFFLFRKLQ